MKLKEEQLGNVFQCFIHRLSDEKKDTRNRRKCAELLGKLSMKWNEKQLDNAFNSLKDIFNKEQLTLKDMRNKKQLILKDIHNKENLVGTYREALKTITVELFNCEGYIYHYEYADLLYGIAQRLDEKQMNMIKMNIKIFVSSALKYLK
ncbi:hypothetical protein RFI_34310 [Reticulomyxa filosa]|uniref:Uncharacterized protein n=1 Tax=Reticulomyxa filosa TaxID=46433 RepID=X6LQT0_RETFI|nr:hypothetical protein RFI_34310 [Reticulomyxa filosa]|eukprot:ETO03100.1 hypothetical protein RFI_34310 [Reticulomyxa filosa]